MDIIDYSRQHRVLVVSILILLLIIAGLSAFLFWSAAHPHTPDANAASKATSTPAAGERMLALALSKVALTSLFDSQLASQNSPLSNVQVMPMPNNGLVLTLDLTINVSGLHRVLPVEMDTTVGLDAYQNLALRVQHLKRDGLDAGPVAAASMQDILNQLVLSAVMPTLHSQIKGARLVSVQTSSTIACNKGVEMLVVQVAAPPVPGIAAQPTPSTFCVMTPSDLNKLSPGS